MRNIKENIVDEIKMSIEGNSKEAEKYLINYFSELNKEGFNDDELLRMKTSDGATLIDLAISEGLQNFLCFIVKYYTNFAKVQNKEGNTFLHKAARKGFSGVLITALDVDQDFAKVQNKKGETFLHIAAWGGLSDVLIKALEINPELLTIKTRRGGQSVFDCAMGEASKKYCDFSEFFRLVDQTGKQEVSGDAKDGLNRRNPQNFGEDRR